MTNKKRLQLTGASSFRTACSAALFMLRHVMMRIAKPIGLVVTIWSGEWPREDRAEQAVQWLHKIYAEIDDRFL